MDVTKKLLMKYKLTKFIYLLVKDFFVKDGFDKVSSLSYTILMSFVPFLVSIASIATFFLPTKTYFRFEKYLLDNNLPMVGKEIASYIEAFHKHSGQLSLVSLFFLFFSAILMIRSLSRHLIQLYEIKAPANIGISIFFLIIVILLFVSIGVGLNSYIIWAIKLNHSVIPKLISLFVEIFAFTVIYKFVPINHASLRHSLIAGAIAAILFEAAKYGFVIYIKHFTSESILYGALASLPIFLLWLYLSCLILLLCANIIVILQKMQNNEI